jgi:hypothetical protein
LESEQASVVAARARLQQVEADLRTAKAERAAPATAEPMLLPTPEQEGWWPANRPYFYLAKKYLTRIRFEGRPQAIGLQPGDAFKGAFAPREYIWMDYQPFSDGRINPHLAILLGMSDEEVTAVNGSYADFLREVRRIEAANIQRVEPPQPDADNGPVVVARLPTLGSEIQPVLGSWDQALDQALGSSRGQILRNLAQQYFDEKLDKLGAEPREFLRTGFGLNVRYTDPWGNHSFNAVTFNLNSVDPTDWEYSHLFGPGAPCELK